MTLPSSAPAAVPSTPIRSPSPRNTVSTIPGVAPIVRSTPMSRRFSSTTMNRVLTMLNAATSTMSARITNITVFSSFIHVNRNLFTWMKLEKTVMFVILALIVLVAAFNIVSTLFMVVLEKRRDIGVLRTMGATPGILLTVFFGGGLLMRVVGTAAGALLGSVMIALLQRYPFVHLPGDVYFIETLPLRPEAGDFAAVILAALGLCLAAAWYPAWRASRLDPIEAIRQLI